MSIDKIKTLDRNKIIRPNLGDASLKAFEPVLNDILKKIEFIEKYQSQVAPNIHAQVSSHINNIYNQLQTLVNWDQTQFVANQQAQINNITAELNSLKQYWSQYAIAAIESSGLLDNIDVKKEFETLTKNLQKTTNEALKKIEDESNVIISQAKKKAEEIENSVRKTAQKISVEEAQEQFRLAAQHNLMNIKIWGTITGLLIIVFIIFIIYLLQRTLPEIWTWQIVYYSVLRATAIGFIGTLLAFSLRILKAHLHMHQHNMHRQRIANSMTAFVESAMNNEQRDIILSRLVDSVTAFGNSGMVNSDDDSNSKITVDNITRTINAIKGKE